MVSMFCFCTRKPFSSMSSNTLFWLSLNESGNSIIKLQTIPYIPPPTNHGIPNMSPKTIGTICFGPPYLAWIFASPQKKTQMQITPIISDLLLNGRWKNGQTYHIPLKWWWKMEMNFDGFESATKITKNIPTKDERISPPKKGWHLMTLVI